MNKKLGYVTRINGNHGYASILGGLSDEVRFELISETGTPSRPLRVGDWIEFVPRSGMVAEFSRHHCQQYITAPAAIVSGERQHFDVAMIPHRLMGMRGDTTGDRVVGSVGNWEICFRPGTKELFKTRRFGTSANPVSEYLTHVTFSAKLPESEIAARFSPR